MGSLAGLLLLAAATLAPNGSGLHPTLAAATDFPIGVLTATAPRLWVVYHANSEWPMAFYVPASAGESERETPQMRLSLFLLGADPRAERLLPELEVPRLFLYEPYYRPDGRLRTVAEMPLDVTQYFMSALIEGRFNLEPPHGLEVRMAAHAPDLTPEQGHDAFLSALAEFGSHALSVAGEMHRSLARQRAAGKDPCRVVDHPATLFGLWGRVFTDQEYRGQYRVAGPAASGMKLPGTARGRWVQGPPLSERDRRLFVEDFFGGAWNGDVRQDFGLECPPGGS